MPIENIFEIDVDIKQKTAIRTPTVTQNDAVVFIFRVFDEGRIYNVQDGSTFTMTSTRPDKQAVVTVGTIAGENIVQFMLGTTEIAVVGKIESVIQIYDADGRVSTIPFNFKVLKDPTVDYVPSEDDQTLIQKVLGEGPVILADAQQATVDANAATANANEKAGLAQIAADNANTATSDANNAATNANEKAVLADMAAQGASTAKTAAESAAARANSAADLIEGWENLCAYDNTIAYVPNNIVTYNGSTYQNIVASTGIPPSDGVDNANWIVLARKGVDGKGAVSTVNGIGPDASGNVEITIPDPDLSGLATKQELQGLDNKKINKGELYVNVKDYGAVGDGSTDDTKAFQDAINFLQNGGVIYLPKGIYLTGTLTLNSNITLQGSGIDVSIIKLKNNVNGSLISGALKDNLLIKDLTLDGNADNQTSGSTVTFWKSRKSRISNIKVINSYTIALNMSNVEDSIIENCILIGTLNNTVVSFSNDDVAFSKGNNLIKSNIIENGYLDGIIYNTNNGIVDGNIIKNNGLNPNNTASGIYSNSKTGLIIINNIIVNNDGNGVDLIDCKEIVVGNNFSNNNNSAGIMLSSCQNASLSQNICKNNGVSPATNQNDGITILGACKNISIVGNRCFDEKTVKTQEWGIQVSGTSEKVTITSNLCEGNLNADGININSTGSQIILNSNLPFSKMVTSDIPLDFSLTSNATISLLGINSKIAVIEVVDKSATSFGRFLLRGSNNIVYKLEDPYNLFEITDSGVNNAIFHNGDTYVLKNKKSATNYYSYKITYI